MKKIKFTKENIKAVKKRIVSTDSSVILKKEQKKKVKVSKDLSDAVDHGIGSYKNKSSKKHIENSKRIEKENNILREQIIKYLEANSHKYYIFMSSPSAFIVGKSQKLTTYSVNENSVFMPREHKETKSYLTLILIYYGNMIYSIKDKLENTLIDLGCEVVHIRSSSEIHPKLE
jgi:hypothetical protein